MTLDHVVLVRIQAGQPFLLFRTEFTEISPPSEAIFLFSAGERKRFNSIDSLQYLIDLMNFWARRFFSIPFLEGRDFTKAARVCVCGRHSDTRLRRLSAKYPTL